MRSPCKPPIGFDALCCPQNCCSDGGLSLASIGDTKGYDDFYAGNLDAYTAEELAILERAQSAICDAWEDLNGETYGRFGCEQIRVRPCLPCGYPCRCGCCAPATVLDLNWIECLDGVDWSTITSAMIFRMGDEEEGVQMAPISTRPGTPGHEPYAFYHLDVATGQIHARAKKGCPLPCLPGQDLTVPDYCEGSWYIDLIIDRGMPPKIRQAVADMACINLGRCDKGATKCSTGVGTVISESFEGTTTRYVTPLDLAKLDGDYIGVLSWDRVIKKWGTPPRYSETWLPNDCQRVPAICHHACPGDLPYGLV